MVCANVARTRGRRSSPPACGATRGALGVGGCGRGRPPLAPHPLHPRLRASSRTPAVKRESRTQIKKRQARRCAATACHALPASSRPVTEHPRAPLPERQRRRSAPRPEPGQGGQGWQLCELRSHHVSGLLDPTSHRIPWRPTAHCLAVFHARFLPITPGHPLHHVQLPLSSFPSHSPSAFDSHTSCATHPFLTTASASTIAISPPASHALRQGGRK